jgi:hypothetical protein
MFKRIVQNTYNTYYESILEVADYNPDKDTMAIFVGTEEDIPPKEVFEEIKKVLDDLPSCKILLFPGVFRLVLLKGVKKNGRKV